jgi:hypothetical protein
MTVAACEVQLVAIQSAERAEFMRIAEEHFRGLSSSLWTALGFKKVTERFVLATKL